MYYVAFDLGAAGLAHVTVDAGRVGPRTITGLKQTITSATWLDSGETLAVQQHGDQVQLTCTGYPYGTDLVVRMARLTAA